MNILMIHVLHLPLSLECFKSKKHNFLARNCLFMGEMESRVKGGWMWSSFSGRVEAEEDLDWLDLTGVNI